MGLPLPLIPLLLISSSLANPIPLDKVSSFSPDDIGLLEQNAPETTPLERSDRMTCDNSGADRCLLFPIGCIPSVSCTDRLEMRRVQSGSNIGDIIVSLNLHVDRSDHMLVAVPMPDISNPNSTFLIGCSIEDAVAVVAKPDVDGVTEQLQLSWLRLVAVRASSRELECIVSASPGHVDLPEGDVAVFAGELQPEEEVRQSARIAGSVEDETKSLEEMREEEREGMEGHSTIHKISPSHSSERTTPSLVHSESEPILRETEDQRPSTTEIPHHTTVAVSSKSNKLQLKMLHSSESSSAERPHRHSSGEKMHSTHASVHHETTSTTTLKTTTTEIPEVEESTTTTEAPSTKMPEEPSTTEGIEESDVSTTVLPPHHHSTTVLHPHHHSTTVPPTHHHSHNMDSNEGRDEKGHHSHERALVDKEHHSVRMEAVTTTRTEKTKSFEDDEDVSEEEKQLLREINAGHVKEERRDGEEEEERNDETGSRHSDGSNHHRDATIYELTRDAAQDPIGKRPSEHSHSHHSSSHGHSHELRAADDDEEEEEHTKKKKPVHKHVEEEKEEEGREREEEGTEREEEGRGRGRVNEEDEKRQRMGEKNHHRRNEETEEEEDEDEDDSSSVVSLVLPMVVCLIPLIFG